MAPKSSKKDKPLHHLDLLMWNVNHPTGLTNITGIMYFKARINAKKATQLIEKRLTKFDKFTSKVIHQKDHPTWHKDELFDIHSHVHVIALPGNEDDKELQNLISDLISTPLDYTKPLWQIHIIDNYNGGSAVVWRIHHSIGDGASLMKVFLALTDTYSDEAHADEFSPVKRVKKSWKEKLNEAAQLTKETLRLPKKIMDHPEEVKQTMSAIRNTLQDFTEFAMSGSNSDSIYKGKLGVRKKVAWSKVIPLQDIKTIGKHFGATVNDTLLAALTGAIRMHLEAHGQDTNIKFNVACPVDMRHDEHGINLGNKVGAILLNLPLHIVNRKKRFTVISEKTAKLKRSFEPPIAYAYTQFISDFIPRKIEEAGAKLFGSKLMAILSNVPGPRKPVYFADEEIDNILFLLPHTYEMGIAFSVISYNNKVTLGITVDPKVIKDPEAIIENFAIEVDHMLLQVNEG